MANTATVQDVLQFQIMGQYLTVYITSLNAQQVVGKVLSELTYTIFTRGLLQHPLLSMNGLLCIVMMER
ncbi:hypothetical protein A6A26_18340 [Pantoea sp. OXWO6B1]|nr:hypothetical protein A6A26_18340 [Pantoea sp. OXWO6B1]